MQTQEEFFKHHPKVDEFHFTSDGQAFFAKSDAESHATSLEDKTVKTVTRAEIEKADKKAESDKSKSTAAATNKEADEKAKTDTVKK